MIVSKPILKEYCNFVYVTEKRLDELLELIERNCKVIGCKSETEEPPFMDCNKGCPLFFAWQVLDKLRKAFKEEEEVKESGTT